MLLLTGATGTIGRPLLRRLVAAGVPVRCMVRDPRRLGAERVRVQIALGDLADPFSFRYALRGVDTVVHLAAAIRDQPGGSIEELAGIATWRLVRASERAGVERFIFFSALGASTRNPHATPASEGDRRTRGRFLIAHSHDLRALDRLLTRGSVPALASPPLPAACHAAVGTGPGRLSADLGRGRGRLRDGGASSGSTAHKPRARASSSPARKRSPTRALVETVLRSLGRRRLLVGIPTVLMRRTLAVVELLTGPAAFATWDEAELLEVSHDVHERIGRRGAPRGDPEVDARGARRALARAGRLSAQDLPLRAGSPAPRTISSRAGGPTSCTASGSPSSP